jgi:Ni,Fe-hydrogenase III large subunit
MLGQVSMLEFLSAGRPVENVRPWPRFRLDGKVWRRLVEAMDAAEWVLLAEWGEASEVHAALRDEMSGDIAIVSRPSPDHRFFAIGQVRPGAIRLERAIRDVWGLAPEGLEDQRPWLDHGRWPLRRPLAEHPLPATPEPLTYAFLTAEGDGLHQIPVGPVHAGIIEPGHFRFHCQGETVVRLEERLGYVHKGIAAAVAGKPLAEAARIMGRVSGDSTVAYALAFARAVEAATGCEPPPRAHWLRALMAEIERIANHAFDIGAICNDAAFAIMLAHMGVLRERLLRGNALVFGHRLCMDRIVPGGTLCEIDDDAIEALRHLLYNFRKRFEKAVTLYNETPSLLDRTIGTGIVAASLVHRFAASGFIGRASSRGHDSRRTPGYPPYESLDFLVPVMAEGDVHARLMIRVQEVRASLQMTEQIFAQMPEGAVRVAVPSRAGEGMAIVESFRGEVVVWVRVAEDGTVAACHAHDPSWFQWPLLEAAIESNIVADFPLCNKSFNCSYSGHDL